MNLDIWNIGHYRVTSHGGRAFDLYNRNNGAVYSILEEDHSFIDGLRTVSRCETVELKYRRIAGV